MNSAPNIIVRHRPHDQRGITKTAWLDSQHTFSFGTYSSAEHMGFRSLRVINEDHIKPGNGFGMHPHASMEILTYVIQGCLQHQDSLGNGRTIQTGEFQYISAGDGIQHSEFNPSNTETAHFLQIWIQPTEKGGTPRYQHFDTQQHSVHNRLALLAAPDGQDGSAAIKQNAQIYFGSLTTDQSLNTQKDLRYPYAWLQLIKGKLTVENVALRSGDGIAIEGQPFAITASEDAEFLLFKLS